MNQSRSLSGQGRPRNTDATETVSTIPLLTLSNPTRPQREPNTSPPSHLSSPDRPTTGDQGRLSDTHFINSQRRQNTTSSDYSNVGVPYLRPQSTTTSRRESIQAHNEPNGSIVGSSDSPKSVDVSSSRMVNDTPRIRKSEQAIVARKDLGTWDVASLIINKQIGTGIFTAPGLVLSLTGSKTIALSLWVAGGVWALLR
jgi:hypothetical protein